MSNMLFIPEVAISLKVMGLSAVQGALAKVKGSVDKLAEGKPFAGWAMSVMFAGMAIQRTFTSIYKLGTKTFQDISHSVEGMTTQTDMLDGSMAYLGFTIGQALEPIISWLIPIVDTISNWISENETLARWLFIIGFTLGTIATIIGGVVLAFNGFSQAIGIAIKAFSGLWSIGTKVFAFLMANPFILLIAGIIAAVAWIVYLGVKVGGVLEFLKALVRGILRVFAVIVSAIGGAISELWNTIKVLWNMALSFFEGILNAMLKPVNMILSALGRAPIKADFSSFKADTGSFGSSFMNTYGNMMSGYLGWENGSILAAKTPGIDSPSSSGNSSTNINIQNVTIENPKSMEDLMKQIQNVQSGAR